MSMPILAPLAVRVWQRSWRLLLIAIELDLETLTF